MAYPRYSDTSAAINSMFKDLDLESEADPDFHADDAARLRHITRAIKTGYTLHRTPRRMWMYVGLLAGSLTVTAILFQMLQIHRRRSACDLSLVFVLLSMTVQFLWLCYGISHKLPVNIITSTMSLAVTSVLLGMKIHYDAVSPCHDAGPKKSGAALGGGGGEDLPAEEE